MLIFISPLTN